MDPDELERLVVRLENRLRAGWKAAMRGIKDDNSLATLERRIASGDIGTLIEGIEPAIAQFTADLAAGYVHAAQRASRAIDLAVPEQFRFGIAEPRAVEFMQRTAREMAANLIEEQQATARRVVQLGLRDGESARTIAERVQGSIGLTPAQVDQVERYREVLERGDYARARSYELADGRYDGALERAADNGTFLGEERIDAMVDRYRDNWVAERADTVALTEAQNATNAGIEEAFEQALEDEVLELDDLQKTWITRADKRVRHSHKTMHGQTVGFHDMFTTGAGVRIRYPGDENAPSSEVVNCRCRSVVTFLGGQVGSQGASGEIIVTKWHRHELLAA